MRPTLVLPLERGREAVRGEQVAGRVGQLDLPGYRYPRSMGIESTVPKDLPCSKHTPDCEKICCRVWGHLPSACSGWHSRLRSCLQSCLRSCSRSSSCLQRRRSRAVFSSAASRSWVRVRSCCLVRPLFDELVGDGLLQLVDFLAEAVVLLGDLAVGLGHFAIERVSGDDALFEVQVEQVFVAQLDAQPLLGLDQLVPGVFGGAQLELQVA